MMNIKPQPSQLACLTAGIIATTIAITIVVGIASIQARAENLKPISPQKLYGNEILFDVIRAGQNIGQHRVRFSGSDENLGVESKTRIRVDILFFQAYAFDYISKANWQNGVLKSLQALTVDGGKKTKVSAQTVGTKINVSQGGKTAAVAKPVYPSNHWHNGVRATKSVINTITGAINKVKVVKRGTENVETENGKSSATRYSYTGELQADVWYDTKGRWVKLRFDGKDGTPIEFVCRKCQGGAG